MKTASIFTLITLFIASFAIANGPGHGAKTYTIDTEKSTVVWTGKKVTGEHTGNIGITSGELTIEHNKIVATKLVMDMTSITCTDIENPEYNKKLIGHLSSDDFFSIEKNPTSTFEATKVTMNSDGTHMVEGSLTIKGITNAVSFPIQVEVNDGELIAKGTATFDRTKWKIQYGSGKFFENLGDRMVYDDVTLEFNIVAKTN